MSHQTNPWKINSVKKVYESPWIEVNHHEVINPASRPGIYGTIHFKNLAIGIIPLDEDHNTWIVGQWRFPLNSYSWEIIEGGGPLNDSPLESAKRELKEETGIVANKFTLLCNMHTSNSATDEYCHIYLAQGLSFEESEPEESEELVVKKLPFETVYQMVMNGEITDSLSMVGVLKTKLLLNEGKF
ncbi:MAG: NUDIX domain-containing protein [Bacteroidota bacterium]|jgi:ADP-ribose pyrophosphatase|nr:NUDIX hydrolase [Bacteroidota bacterium]MCA6444202.1 NUDIX hydrolase [Bacteroidota bacterium]